MEKILEQIGAIGVVPVIVIDRVEDAIPVCQALREGGLPLAEITFRTEAAEESIRRVAKELPEVLVGAGTVLTVDQAKRAIAAGSKFVVSPGFNPTVVKYCQEQGVPITPGCSNATDLGMAVEYGLDVVKFFPAEASGGLKTLKAISAPFGKLRFVPTGGVDTGNLGDYLAFPKILACGGTWLAKPDVIKAQNWQEITRLAREAITVVLGFELAHLGINSPNAESALGTAERLAQVFGMAAKDGNSSVFAGTAFEMMKAPYLGTNGHVAVRTNSIPRAIAYLEGIGVEIDMETAKRAADGSIGAVYLKEEIAGFAFHLLQKK